MLNQGRFENGVGKPIALGGSIRTPNLEILLRKEKEKDFRLNAVPISYSMRLNSDIVQALIEGDSVITSNHIDGFYIRLLGAEDNRETPALNYGVNGSMFYSGTVPLSERLIMSSSAYLPLSVRGTYEKNGFLTEIHSMGYNKAIPLMRGEEIVANIGLIIEVKK